MAIKSMAEQMIYFAAPQMVRCHPFRAWTGLSEGSFGPDVEMALTFVDTGEWIDILHESAQHPTLAQPMEIKVNVLARSLQTINGIQVITDEQLTEEMRERAELESQDTFPSGVDTSARVPYQTRTRYLVRTIRKWPLHVTNTLFEAYTEARNDFENKLRGEVGKSSPASQAESGGKSENGQDSVPPSGPAVMAD